jgi:glycosyltransferase involved in cell wall biosynthesis
MKILVFEPLRGGHREVILSYVCRVIAEAGHEILVVDSAVGDCDIMFVQLQHMAAEAKCDLIHILSIGDWTRALFLSSIRFGLEPKKVPVVGTYYLYSALCQPLQGLAWDWVILSGAVDRLLISDDYLKERTLPAWRRRYLSYIPDPWAPDEFTLMDKHEACQKLGLDASRVRFLIFGSLGARKGIDLVCEAYATMATNNTELTVVGAWHDSLKGSATEAFLQQLLKHGQARVHASYVPEHDVSAWFCAADYVLCAYPPSFTVSSGTFTRACAAGRPTITPDCGVVGRMVREKNCGFTYQAGTTDALAVVMKRAYMMNSTSDIKCMANRAREISSKRTISQYGTAMIGAYREVVGGSHD